MLNAELRILIAEKRHSQALNIERQLNALGLFRVAPVHSLAELQLLTDCCLPPVDLVIANANLAEDDGIEVFGLCRSNAGIRHAIIYQSPSFTPVFETDAGKTLACLPQAPDREALQRHIGLSASVQV